MTLSRETLAAHLYAINYVKPCFKKDTAFYLTPKQAFKAADKFLAEAAQQRATSTMSFVGGVTMNEVIKTTGNPKIKLPEGVTAGDCLCLPEWRTTVGCAHCGRTEPARPGSCAHSPRDFNIVGQCHICDVGPEKPKSCEHEWEVASQFGHVCRKCRAGKYYQDEEEPAKPKPAKVAREWVITNTNRVTDVFGPMTEKIKVREILEGET